MGFEQLHWHALAGQQRAQFRTGRHPERRLTEPGHRRPRRRDRRRGHGRQPWRNRRQGHGRQRDRRRRPDGWLQGGIGGLVGALDYERQQLEQEHDEDRPRQQPLVAALVESQADAASHGGKLCRQAVLVTAP